MRAVGGSKRTGRRAGGQGGAGASASTAAAGPPANAAGQRGGIGDQGHRDAGVDRTRRPMMCWT